MNRRLSRGRAWAAAAVALAAAAYAAGAQREQDFRWRRRPAILPPLFWYDPDYKDNGSFFMLLCLYWRGRWDQGAFDALAPLYLNVRTRDQRLLAVTPFVWRMEGGAQRSMFVGPLFMRWGGSERVMSLLPLFWDSRTDAGKAKTVFLPVYYRKADSSTPFTRGYAGLFFWDVWRDRRRFVLFPVYWFDERDGRRLTVIPPFYSTRRGASRSWGIAPLVRSYRRGAASGFYALPVAAWKREGAASRTYVFPYYGRRQGDYKLDAVLPLIWRSRKAGRLKRFVAGPFFVTDKTWGVVPIAWVSRGATRGYIFPVAWDSKDKVWCVLPLLFVTENGAALLPFYWERVGADREWGVWPVVAYKRSGEKQLYWRVFPLAKYDRPYGQESRGWVGLWAWRNGPNPWRVLFPFYWRFKGPNRSTTILPPYYSKWRGDTLSLGVFPLYARKEEGRRVTSYLAPIYYNRRDPDAKERLTWCGLYYHRRRPGYSVTAAAPLYWRKAQGRSVRGLCGLYYWSRRPGAVSHVVFPVWWRLAKGEADAKMVSTVVPPFYNTTGPQMLKRGLFPLLWYHRVRDARHMAALPVFWRKDAGAASKGFAGLFWWRLRPGDERRGVFPLVWLRRSKEARRTAALPIFWRRRTADASQGFFGLWWWNDRPGRSRRGLFPLLWLRSDGEGEKRQRIVVIPPFYRSVGPSGFETGLFPFAWVSRRGERKSAALLPFFVHKTRPKGTYLWAAPFWRSTRKDGGGWGVFPLVWVHRTGREKISAALPIFFHGEDSHSAFTLFAPLWFAREDEWRYWGVFPLVWFRWSEAGKGRQIVFPVWWRYWKGEERLTVIPPAYSASGPTRSKVGLFPLAWIRRTQDSKSAAVLPLFWRYRSSRPERSQGFVGPWYWNRGPNSVFQTLCPVYWRQKDDISSRLVIPPFYRMCARDASNTLLFPFFWSWRRGAESRLAVAPLFYSYDAPEAATRLTPLSWYRRRGGDETGLVGPYYWSIDVRGRSRAQVLFPFVWRLADKKAKSLLVAPFYYERASAGLCVRVVLPLGLYVKTPHSETTLVFPYYSRNKAAHHWRRTSLLPLFTRESDDTGYRYFGVLGGFVSYQRQIDRGAEHKRLRVLWILSIPLR